MVFTSKKPKVVLIKPPIPYHIMPSEQQPLGIAYIAAQTIKNGYSVYLADLGEQFVNRKIINEIPEGDIYGITSTFLDLKTSSFVASLLRERDPHSKIVIGGPGPTSTPEQIDVDLFDAFVSGEGEMAFLNLLKDYQECGEIQPRYSAKLIEDLDQIPFPARDLFKVKGGRIFSFGAYFGNDKSTGLITSRGCPYDCAHCATNATWKRKVRFRSVENILGEIEECVYKFEIRQFRIQDDNFTLEKQRLEKICKRILDRRLKIYWRCSTAASLVDLQLLKLMKKAGCVEISYGAETGDPDILSLLNRTHSSDVIIDSTKKAHQAGIKVRLFFMVGLPGTTKKTAERDIEFLKKSKPDALNLAIYTPYPGSAIWKNPEKYGVQIESHDFDQYNMHLFSAENRTIESVISLDSIDKKDLEYSKKAVIEYANNKGIIHK